MLAADFLFMRTHMEDLFCREQLWLFRRMHFRRAGGLGKMGTQYEFAWKFPWMADGTAERS